MGTWDSTAAAAFTIKLCSPKIFADHSRRKSDQGLRGGPHFRSPPCAGFRLPSSLGNLWPLSGLRARANRRCFYLLGGLTQATEGRVVIDGVDFATLDDGERTRLRKQRIGFVFQKFNLLPTLSAMGNIEIAYASAGAKSRSTGRILTI